MKEETFTLLIYRIPFDDNGYHAECLQYPNLASDGESAQAAREAMVAEIREAAGRSEPVTTSDVIATSIGIQVGADVAS